MSIVPRLHPRTIAREIALLSLSQVNIISENVEQEELNNLVLSAIRTIREETHQILEAASAELKKSSEQLFASETRASKQEISKSMLRDAIKLTQTAINLLGEAVELPELLELAKQHEVHKYTLEILSCIHRRNKEIEEKIEMVLVDWQFNRLSKIDRDLLRIAVAEILYLEIPKKVAINEAVELAKRYSDEEGYRFINGVLRRVTEKIKTEQ